MSRRETRDSVLWSYSAFANHVSGDGHDEVTHQTGDDFAKGAANNHGHGQIADIALDLDGKCFEIFQ